MRLLSLAIQEKSITNARLVTAKSDAVEALPEPHSGLKFGQELMCSLIYTSLQISACKLFLLGRCVKIQHYISLKLKVSNFLE